MLVLYTPLVSGKTQIGSLIIFSLMKKTASGELDVGVLKTLHVEFKRLRSRVCKGHKNIGTYTMGVQ